MLNLNVPPMVNNEQMPILNIPFPNVISNQCVTYGILEGSNIGYIYLAQEYPEATADAQLYQAVNLLKNTDALIIDMRLNFGGWALFDNAFQILFNDFYKTIEDALRCNINTFDLCPDGQWYLYQIDGMGPDYYDRPIALLLGPTCVSMGDLTAQRFRYHPMVRFFGASSDATLGYNTSIENFPNWDIYYSIGDMFHTNTPGVYLNRREFPIDFLVWHNPDDVAIGKDAVVENALGWINNLVYPHTTFSDKTFYTPGEDTVHISTIIENPNSHQLSARGYIYDLNNVLVDSTDLTEQVLNADGEIWTGNMITPSIEEFFKVSVTAFDQTSSNSFTVPNATRFTTAGPVVLDSIIYTKISGKYYCRPYLTNKGDSTLYTVSGKLICNDPWVISINPSTWNLQILPPDITTPSIGYLIVSVIDSLFQDYFNFEAQIGCDTWPYWVDSLHVVVGVEDGPNEVPTEFLLSQNYPNPFNPSTSIQYAVSSRQFVSLKIYDVLGNEIETLVNEEKPAGTFEVTWYAESLPSGVYFYKLSAGSYIETKKMLLLK